MHLYYVLSSICWLHLLGVASAGSHSQSLVYLSVLGFFSLRFTLRRFGTFFEAWGPFFEMCASLESIPFEGAFALRRSAFTPAKYLGPLPIWPQNVKFSAWCSAAHICARSWSSNLCGGWNKFSEFSESTSFSSSQNQNWYRRSSLDTHMLERIYLVHPFTNVASLWRLRCYMRSSRHQLTIRPNSKFWSLKQSDCLQLRMTVAVTCLGSCLACVYLYSLWPGLFPKPWL